MEEFVEITLAIVSLPASSLTLIVAIAAIALAAFAIYAVHSIAKGKERR